MRIRHGGIRDFAMARPGNRGYTDFTEYGVAIASVFKRSGV